MPKEIERKFLVDISKWNAIAKPTGKPIRQGYLSTDPHRIVRVRLYGSKAFLTIKGIDHGPVRDEFEYEIPFNEASEILETCSLSELSKIRYRIEHAGNTWEVDVFSDDNEGLIIAEIELKYENQPIELPPWVTEEVTNDRRYYNSNLTVSPYKKWPK